MQIPILNGVYASSGADFRTSYPRNMVPVPKQTGISEGYLRSAWGLERFDNAALSLSGVDRGGINWNGICYRVIGTNLVTVSATGVIAVLGTIPGSDRVVMDYSFDRLAIAANGGLYYWAAGVLTQVTDADLGTVNDMLWVDGYFMTTDGNNLVVTELTDPTQVNPLKYGSSEVDPDPVIGIVKLADEIYALNRHTIEAFSNTGGELFPFSRINGAEITKGLIGRDAKCLIAQTFAFVGGGRREPIAVYLMAQGSASPISTREIDVILNGYSEAQQTAIILESRIHHKHELLLMHLPDQTLVYDVNASAVMQQPIWFFLSSSSDAQGAYRARNFVECYGKTVCGDTIDARIGFLSDDVITQYGVIVGYQFDTLMIYNGGKAAIVHSMELVGLPGRAVTGQNPVVFGSWSDDGLTWSDEKPKSIGHAGERNRRIQWRKLGKFRNYRQFRFRGVTSVPIAYARLEAEIEALS